MQSAKVICDSIGEKSPRLHTQLWRYPSMVHQESLRHRTLYIHDQLAMNWDFDFSFSVSSTRAVPFKKNLEEVRSDKLRAKPAKWGSEQKGMVPGDELDAYVKIARFLDPKDGVLQYYEQPNTPDQAWREAALQAADIAERFADAGYHKSICNRIIAPYLHTNCLTTGTHDGWMNFFGLRLDSAADPTLRALAEESWKAWNESEPKLLKPGEWHLPFIDEEIRHSVSEYTEGQYIANEYESTGFFGNIIPFEEKLIRISVARCARLSYMSFETGKRSSIEEDLKLYERLVGGPIIHASPAEHQSTPDIFTTLPPTHTRPAVWLNEDQAGNLGRGWRQYRKMLKNEAVAPLPEQYR